MTLKRCKGGKNFSGTFSPGKVDERVPGSIIQQAANLWTRTSAIIFWYTRFPIDSPLRRGRERGIERRAVYFYLGREKTKGEEGDEEREEKDRGKSCRIKRGSIKQKGGKSEKEKERKEENATSSNLCLWRDKLVCVRIFNTRFLPFRLMYLPRCKARDRV